MRQVLELLLLWPQGKGAGREGSGRDDVIQGGLVVRKNREKTKIDRKQAGERTKEKENRGERQEKGRKLNEIKRKESRKTGC